jgi:hypothetical protein
VRCWKGWSSFNIPNSISQRLSKISILRSLILIDFSLMDVPFSDFCRLGDLCRCFSRMLSILCLKHRESINLHIFRDPFKVLRLQIRAGGFPQNSALSPGLLPKTTCQSRYLFALTGRIIPEICRNIYIFCQFHPVLVPVIPFYPVHFVNSENDRDIECTDERIVSINRSRFSHFISLTILNGSVPKK